MHEFNRGNWGATAKPQLQNRTHFSSRRRDLLGWDRLTATLLLLQGNSTCMATFRLLHTASRLGVSLGSNSATTASSLACQTAAGTKLVLAMSCSLPQLLRSGAFHRLALMQTGRLSWNTVHDLCSVGVTFLLPLTALPAGVSLDARSADFIANASSCQEMVQTWCEHHGSTSASSSEL